MRPITHGRRLAEVLGATLVAGGLVLSAAGIASATVDATPVGPSAVVISGNFGAYPSIVIPPGCSDGEAFLVGETYTKNGGPAFPSLREGEGIGEFAPGDIIEMKWVSFAGGDACATEVGVSLAVKSSTSPDFNAAIDQALLLDFAYCGPGGTSCATAGNTLRIVMPDFDEPLKQDPPLDPACAYQVDAVLGGPLAVVGPNGSFYGSSLRSNGGPNMLISANNGGPETCATVKKTVVVNPDNDPNFPDNVPPADRDYLICLTPADQGPGEPGEGAVSCPANAIAVLLKAGGSDSFVATPGTQYTVTEIIDGQLYLANGPLPLTIVEGHNLINLTNIYQCEDSEASPPTPPGYTVVVDVDCTEVTTTTAGTTTTQSTTTTIGTTTTQSTTTTIGTTTTQGTTPTTTPTSTPTTTPTTTATTTATTTPSGSATTAPNRGAPVPPPEVGGTVVQPAEELPVTGNRTWEAARLGILMVLSGAAALALSKRRRVDA